ncbi:hypothetical protein QJQ45_006712 [Haematococcus lacustris]|nr:hypothetical protein QJQ45_006712 [Haematococcus lacustris]
MHANAQGLRQDEKDQDDCVIEIACSSVDHHQPEQPVSLPGAPQPQFDNEAELARVAQFQEHFRELDQALTALQPLPGPPTQPTGTPLRLFNRFAVLDLESGSRKRQRTQPPSTATPDLTLTTDATTSPATTSHSVVLRHMGSVARVLKRLSWSDRAAVISLLQEQGIIEQPADSHILGAMVLARMKTLNQTGTCGKAGGQRLADLQAKANLARLVPPEVKEQRRVTAFAKASGMDRAAVAQAASENATALTTDPTGRLLYFTERLDQRGNPGISQAQFDGVRQAWHDYTKPSPSVKDLCQFSERMVAGSQKRTLVTETKRYYDSSEEEIWRHRKMKGKKRKGADEPKQPNPKVPKPERKDKPDTVGWPPAEARGWTQKYKDNTVSVLDLFNRLMKSSALRDTYRLKLDVTRKVVLVVCLMCGANLFCCNLSNVQSQHDKHCKQRPAAEQPPPLPNPTAQPSPAQPFTPIASIEARRAFWKLQAAPQFPILAKAAQRLLSAHASTAAAERNWSVWGHTYHNALRNNLSVEAAKREVYLKANVPTTDSDDEAQTVQDTLIDIMKFHVHVFLPLDPACLMLMLFIVGLGTTPCNLYVMDLTSGPLRLPALRLDGVLMHPPARPLRSDGVAQAIKAAHAMRDLVTGQVLRQWEWELSKGQLKHDSGLIKAKQDTARWSTAIQPQLQQLADATPAGTTLDSLQAHIQALKSTWSALWEEYLKPRWRQQRLGLHHAQERVVNGMKWVSRHHYHQERGVAVYLGAGNCSQGGWKAEAVREGFRMVVEQPSRPSTVNRPDRLVIVDEFRTTRVSSSVHARQPCELHLPDDRPRPADWVPPAGQVNQRLLRPAWSLRHAKGVRGLKWCHEVPPNPPPPPPAQHPPAQEPPAPAQAILAQDPPAPAQDQPPAPPPAQDPPPPPPAQEPPPPAQDQPPAQSPPGPVPRPQAPSWGRWLDRDNTSCLNFQRIGESMQRPLELCSYEGLMALPPIGKEYQQGYKRVNDRLPKVKQRLHRAAEYRRGIDGRARNNA